MTPITFLLVAILTGILLIVVYCWIDKLHTIRLNKFKEYEKKYRIIQYRIHFDKKTPENYSGIERMLICLGSLPYKNKEKTIKLSENLWQEWTNERLSRVNTHLEELCKD